MALAVLTGLIHLIDRLPLLDWRWRVPHIRVFEGFGSGGFAICTEASIGGSEIIIGLSR